jgi:hypothetical protein
MTDVILKMKRFPLLFSPCCPVTPKSAPCYFLRGISLETLMESAFVDDIGRYFGPNFAILPLYFALLFPPQWRRVRIRLHPQPRSRVSVNPGRFRLAIHEAATTTSL